MNGQGTLISAAGGHLIDLWRLFRFEISHPHSLSKLRQLVAVRERTGATSLIETGTFLGNTANRSSRFFEKVYTIEVDETLHQKAKQFLKSRPNVECLLGDCAVVLPALMTRLQASDEKVILFLDGHFSGGVTGCGDEAEPALTLLDSLGKFRPGISGIVIDDFRTLTGRDGMPSKSSVFAAIEKHFPDFVTQVHLDQIVVEAA